MEFMVVIISFILMTSLTERALISQRENWRLSPLERKGLRNYIVDIIYLFIYLRLKYCLSLGPPLVLPLIHSQNRNIAMLVVYGLQHITYLVLRMLYSGAWKVGFPCIMSVKEALSFWKRDKNPFSKPSCHKSHSQSIFLSPSHSARFPVISINSWSLECLSQTQYGS